jgi:enoyl-CoA hydratase/carnithine racemase
VIRREVVGDVAVVTLSRAEKRNALTPGMLGELRGVIERLKSTEIAEPISVAREARALVLAGDGKVFCGGFDLKMCQDEPGTLELLLRGLHEVIAALRGLPVPVVVAAHGAAIAGGCALLGGADVVVTDAGAKLGYPVTPLGISPAVSAPFLRLLTGDGRARERLLDPALVSGREAARIGLAHECVELPEQVRPRALEIAVGLAAKPAGAVRATRGWLREIEDLRGGGGADVERGLRASLSVVGSGEEREGLARLFRDAVR